MCAYLFVWCSSMCSCAIVIMHVSLLVCICVYLNVSVCCCVCVHVDVTLRLCLFHVNVIMYCFGMCQGCCGNICGFVYVFPNVGQDSVCPWWYSRIVVI